jgi:16S rRNA (cytidine1402-2'-O)-methyltransferase
MLWFDRVRLAAGTVIFYEAPHRIHRTLEELRDNFGDCPIVVARELTKVHEEVLRGPVSGVLDQLASPRGEFTVVARIGHMIELVPVPAPDDRQILAEFGETTNYLAGSRRDAVALLASKHRMTRNDVYAAIERAKKSVK